ncbi:hypothetical protein GCM10022419_132850 [Nonomuraea rosea]|uniref:Uncharacterized protein n=1 Tax=Nonomuraea rosea TaxID=638574 RepID=A0ABP7A4C5_9ACTN
MLAGWPIDEGHLLELWPHSRTAEGRLRWLYRLTRCNRTVFSATDITSPVGTVVSTSALISSATTALRFLTLRPGDTDAGYFDAYTRTQITWRDRFAEELSLYAQEDACGYCGRQHSSPGCGVG